MVCHFYPFLFQDHSKPNWCFCHLTERFERPTLSCLLKTVRGSIIGCFSLGLDHLVVHGSKKTGLCICTPQNGLAVQVSKTVQESILKFTARRHLRRDVRKCTLQCRSRSTFWYHCGTDKNVILT